MHRIKVATPAKQAVLDITPHITALLSAGAFTSGLCHVFCAHTTAAITTADLDTGTDLDMLDAFRGMVPRLPYRHPHNPAHAPDHILATLIGPSVTVPVHDGALQLGVWQRIVLFEFDGPRQRDICVTFLG